MPNPDAMELPRATYRSPRRSVEPIDVVVVVDAIEVDGADAASPREDEVSLEQPIAPSVKEPETIIDARRDMSSRLRRCVEAFGVG
jgi:hypothetical protein